MFIVDERRPHAPRQSQHHTWLTQTLSEVADLVADLTEDDPLIGAAFGAHATPLEGELTGEAIVLRWGPVS